MSFTVLSQTGRLASAFSVCFACLACAAESTNTPVPAIAAAGAAGAPSVAAVGGVGAVSGAGSGTASAVESPGGSTGSSGAGAGGSAGAGGAGGGAGTGGGPVSGVPIPFQSLKSVSYTNGCGNKSTEPGATSEVEPGLAYDLSGYGLEMGFHCDIDHGHFAYAEVTGDFDFVARIDAVSTADGMHHARAGLMARKLPAGSGDMFVNVTVSSNYTATHFADLRNFAVRMSEKAKLPGAFYYHVDQREPPDGDHHTRIPLPREFPNEWLRLRRIGNTYMAWYGYDGINWTEHRRHDEEAPQAPEVAWTVDLGETVALGLSLEASPEHSFTTRANARFRDIRLTRPAPTQ